MSTVIRSLAKLLLGNSGLLDERRRVSTQAVWCLYDMCNLTPSTRAVQPDIDEALRNRVREVVENEDMRRLLDEWSVPMGDRHEPDQRALEIMGLELQKKEGEALQLFMELLARCHHGQRLIKADFVPHPDDAWGSKIVVEKNVDGRVYVVTIVRDNKAHIKQHHDYLTVANTMLLLPARDDMHLEVTSLPTPFGNVAYTLFAQNGTPIKDCLVAAGNNAQDLDKVFTSMVRLFLRPFPMVYGQETQGLWRVEASLDQLANIFPRLDRWKEPLFDHLANCNYHVLLTVRPKWKDPERDSTPEHLSAGLVHGDEWSGNFLMHEGRTAPIDFEDAVLVQGLEEDDHTFVYAGGRGASRILTAESTRTVQNVSFNVVAMNSISAIARLFTSCVQEAVVNNNLMNETAALWFNGLLESLRRQLMESYRQSLFLKSTSFEGTPWDEQAQQQTIFASEVHLRLACLDWATLWFRREKWDAPSFEAFSKVLRHVPFDSTGDAPLGKTTTQSNVKTSISTAIEVDGQERLDLLFQRGIQDTTGYIAAQCAMELDKGFRHKSAAAMCVHAIDCLEEDDQYRLRLMHELTKMEHNLQNTTKAREINASVLQQLSSQGNEHTDLWFQARAWKGLLMMGDDHRAARKLLEENYEQLKHRENPLLAQTLRYLGHMYYEEEDYEAAIQFFQKASSIYHHHGDFERLSYCKTLVAKVYCVVVEKKLKFGNHDSGIGTPESEKDLQTRIALARAIIDEALTFAQLSGHTLNTIEATFWSIRILQLEEGDGDEKVVASWEALYKLCNNSECNESTKHELNWRRGRSLTKAGRSDEAQIFLMKAFSSAGTRSRRRAVRKLLRT